MIELENEIDSRGIDGVDGGSGNLCSAMQKDFSDSIGP